jgi:hypothetical protein
MVQHWQGPDHSPFAFAFGKGEFSVSKKVSKDNLQAEAFEAKRESARVCEFDPAAHARPPWQPRLGADEVLQELAFLKPISRSTLLC